MLSASHALCSPGHTFDISSLHLFKSLDNLWNKIQPTLVDLLRCLTCPGTGPSRVGPVPPGFSSSSCHVLHGLNTRLRQPPGREEGREEHHHRGGQLPVRRPWQPGVRLRGDGEADRRPYSRAVIKKNMPKFIAGNVVGSTVTK